MVKEYGIRAYKAIQDYFSPEPKNLEFQKGDDVTHVKVLNKEWALGRNKRTKKTGCFPISFIEYDKSLWNRLSFNQKPKIPKTSHRTTVIETADYSESDDEEMTMTSETQKTLPAKDELFPSHVTNLTKLIKAKSYHGKAKEKKYEYTMNAEILQKNTRTLIDELKLRLQSKNPTRSMSFRTQSLIRRIVVAVCGVLLGAILCGALFSICVFSFGYSYKVSGIVTGSVFLLVLIGVGGSRFLSCCLLLVVPSLFTSQGRSLALAAIFILLMAGPGTNVVKNTVEISRCLACVADLIQNQLLQLAKQIKAPFDRIAAALRDVFQRVLSGLQEVIDTIDAVATKVQSFLKKVKEIASKITGVFTDCAATMEKAKGECESAIGKAETACDDALKAAEEWLKKAAEKIISPFKKVASLWGKRRKRALGISHSSQTNRTVSQKYKIPHSSQTNRTAILKDRVPHSSQTNRTVILKDRVPHSNQTNRTVIGMENTSLKSRSDRMLIQRERILQSSQKNKTTIGRQVVDMIPNTDLTDRKEGYSQSFDILPFEPRNNSISSQMIASSWSEVPISSEKQRTNRSVWYFLGDEVPFVFEERVARRKRSICSVLGAVDVVCNVVDIPGSICKAISFASNGLENAAQSAMNEFQNLKSEFVFGFNASFDIDNNINSSKSASQIVDQVLADISSKVSNIFKISSFISQALGVTVFFLFLKAVIYMTRYMKQDFYDNIYISPEFIEYDKRCQKEGREWVLPLKFKEHSKYIITSLPFPTAQELSLAMTGLTTFFTHFGIAVVVIGFNYALYYLLVLIEKYGQVMVLSSSVSGLNVTVEGSGFLANFLRNLISNLDLNVNITLEFNVTECLPSPNQPNESDIPIFSLLYGGVLFLVLIQMYSLRIRRVITSHFYPDRERERCRLLHELIRHRRKTLFTYVRQRLHLRRHDVDNRVSIRGLLEYSQFGIFCKPLLDFCLPKKATCISCEEEASGNVSFRKCKKCKSLYCKNCFEMFQNNCLLCHARQDIRVGNNKV
ncbi:DC-STAMP domain-containing protein 2-like [Saccostrea cucullata]|uniref:DC-STAMP domain-containing protein 2-like n=1 Tax=Saccostrea cuccullata TaxID=36930 RepID=UPI002ECFAE32